MTSFILTNKALEDISKIWDYTFEIWSESQADKYYQMLIESCHDLGIGVSKGKAYPEILKDVYGYQIGQHIIFYRHIKSNKIEIARILHSRMDLRSKLEE